MKQLFLLCMVCIFCSNYSIAQNKKELISQNQELKFQLDSVKRIVSDAKKNENIAQMKAEEMESQVSELKDANATLMKNLNNFASLSSKTSENMNLTMAALEAKEAQLKGINDAFISNDSTQMVLLARGEKILGENGNIQAVNGQVVIAQKPDYYFKDGLGTTVTPAAKTFLGSIAKLLQSNPKTMVMVENLTMTGEMDIALQQASAVAAILIKDYAIPAANLVVKASDGGLKESVQINIIPDYESFYRNAKSEMKNQ